MVLLLTQVFLSSFLTCFELKLGFDCTRGVPVSSSTCDNDRDRLRPCCCLNQLVGDDMSISSTLVTRIKLSILGVLSFRIVFVSSLRAFAPSPPQPFWLRPFHFGSRPFIFGRNMTSVCDCEYPKFCLCGSAQHTFSLKVLICGVVHKPFVRLVGVILWRRLSLFLRQDGVRDN